MAFLGVSWALDLDDFDMVNVHEKQTVTWPNSRVNPTVHALAPGPGMKLRDYRKLEFVVYPLLPHVSISTVKKPSPDRPQLKGLFCQAWNQGWNQTRKPRQLLRSCSKRVPDAVSVARRGCPKRSEPRAGHAAGDAPAQPKRIGPKSRAFSCPGRSEGLWNAAKQKHP